jgi:hypothetical protein
LSKRKGAAAPSVTRIPIFHVWGAAPAGRNRVFVLKQSESHSAMS